MPAACRAKRTWERRWRAKRSSLAGWWIGEARNPRRHRLRKLVRNRLNPAMSIHPTAIVDPSAKVPASSSIGPYCVVGADVELGENCQLLSHVVVGGPTKIGSDNQIHSFAAIGGAPQDITYRGEPTR